MLDFFMSKKILVTGGSGMVGCNLKSLLPEAMYVNSKYDLRNSAQTLKLFSDYYNIHKAVPDVVIHMAARVGGIKDNAENPYDFYIENTKINTNVIDMCVANKIPKLIALSSTCVYPKNAKKYPMTEDMIHDGGPEPTNWSYAYAKRMMQVHIDAARKQFDFAKKWNVLYPTNLYGPHDKFNLQKSHVIPSLILKMQNNPEALEVFGTGSARRQFLYVEDLCNTILDFVKMDIKGDYNVSPMADVTIKDLVHLLVEITNYKGKIVWTGGLEGQIAKQVSNQKLFAATHKYDYTPLRKGLEETYEWYQQNILGD